MREMRVRDSFVLFAFQVVFVILWNLDCTFLVALARSETAYVIVMFFYFNFSLKDKLVIELNSLANVDSLRSRKFVCSLKVVDSSSWNFFSFVHYWWSRTRLDDPRLRQNSRRPLWDRRPPLGQSVFGTTNCNVVFGDTMPYDSCISTSLFWILVDG